MTSFKKSVSFSDPLPPGVQRRTIPNYVKGAKVRTHQKSIRDLEPDELDYYQAGRNEPKPPDANYVSAVKKRNKGETTIYEVIDTDENKRIETTNRNFSAMFSQENDAFDTDRSIPMSHDHKELLIGMGVSFTPDGLVDVDNLARMSETFPNEDLAEQKMTRGPRPFRQQRLEETYGSSRRAAETEPDFGSPISESISQKRASSMTKTTSNTVNGVDDQQAGQHQKKLPNLRTSTTKNDEWEQVTSDFSKLTCGPLPVGDLLATTDDWDTLAIKEGIKKVDQWEIVSPVDTNTIQHPSANNQNPQQAPSTSKKGKPAPQAKSDAEDDWEKQLQNTNLNQKLNFDASVSSTEAEWGSPESIKFKAAVQPPPQLKIKENHVETTPVKKKDDRFEIPLFTEPNLEGDPGKFSTVVVKRAYNKDDMVLVCIDKDVEEAIEDLHFEMCKKFIKEPVTAKRILRPGQHYALRTVESYGALQFFRVQLLHLLDDSRAFVFFVDLGKEKSVETSQLYRLRSEWIQVPQRAIYAQLFPAPGKIIGGFEKDESFEAQHKLKTYKIQTFFTGNVHKVIGKTPVGQVPRAIVEFKFK